ncbi:hypothetical protein JCM3774_005485 [Rhodotorula dairenensis]
MLNRLKAALTGSGSPAKPQHPPAPTSPALGRDSAQRNADMPSRSQPDSHTSGDEQDEQPTDSAHEDQAGDETASEAGDPHHHDNKNDANDDRYRDDDDEGASGEERGEQRGGAPDEDDVEVDRLPTPPCADERKKKRRRRKIVSSSSEDEPSDAAATDDEDGTYRAAKRTRSNPSRTSRGPNAAQASQNSTRSRASRAAKKSTTRRTVSTGANRDVGTDHEEEVDELEGAEAEEDDEEGSDSAGVDEDERAQTDYGSSSEEELIQLTEKDIVELEDPELVAHFTKLRNGDVNRGPIGVGDVVKLRPSGGNDSWLAVVERIHAKNSTLKPAVGDNRNESDFVGIQLSWLYARTDFEKLHPSNPAWKVPCKVMGPNERVKTDHTDWNHQSMVLSRDPELCYVFDDCYPAIPPNGIAPASHPLSLFSINGLHSLAPSIYSWPALEALSKRSRTIAPITAQRKIPSYFFGVSAVPTIDPLLPRDETGGPYKKLDGGKDGAAGIPYVRVGFAFKPLPAVRASDSDEGEIEGAEGWTSGKGAQKEGRGKRKSSTAATAKKKDPLRKTWPLKFSEHSTSAQPYNPRYVQHYSRANATWYDVRDLKKLRVTSPGITRQRSPDAPAPFSLDLEASTFNPAAATAAVLIEKVGLLATDKLVRGGAYGLTGNAYLVTRAGDVHSRLSESEVAYDAEDLDEARTLLADAVAWREEVQRRVDGVREGQRLAKEWRSLGDADLPPGHEWLCPETKEPM